jgi:hypothetical protein
VQILRISFIYTQQTLLETAQEIHPILLVFTLRLICLLLAVVVAALVLQTAVLQGVAVQAVFYQARQH